MTAKLWMFKKPLNCILQWMMHQWDANYNSIKLVQRTRIRPLEEVTRVHYIARGLANHMRTATPVSLNKSKKKNKKALKSINKDASR